jgi:glycosyltransferase involved in cell wall biosynthesis
MIVQASEHHLAANAGTVATTSRTIKVAIYNASERYCGHTTGVGKHVNHMVAGLARRSRFGVTFWVPRDYYAADQSCSAKDPLHDVQSRPLPMTRRGILLSSLAMNGPAFETMTGPVDIVYSPREQIFSTRTAKRVLTIHDVYRFDGGGARAAIHPAELILRAAWRTAVRRASLVLTVSEFSKQRICRLLGADASRVVVVGNGVEELFFRAAEIDPQFIDPFDGKDYFLAVGGLTRKKGAANLIRLARLLERKARDTVVAVIGPVETEYQAEVGALRNLVVVERGLSDERVAELVRGAIAIVVLSNYEGFGIPALEAMAANVPVVGNTAAAALTEVIGDAGLMINASLDRELEHVLALRNDTSMRDHFVRRGQVRVQHWRWERCVERLAEVLGEIAE